KTYRLATAGPESFDCSGLGYFCIGVAEGSPLDATYRSSARQAEMGRPIFTKPANHPLIASEVATLQPGDFIIFSGGDIPERGHVGYVLDPAIPTMVNALNEEAGVVIT